MRTGNSCGGNVRRASSRGLPRIRQRRATGSRRHARIGQAWVSERQMRMTAILKGAFKHKPNLRAIGAGAPDDRLNPKHGLDQVRDCRPGEEPCNSSVRLRTEAFIARPDEQVAPQRDRRVRILDDNCPDNA